MNKENYDLFIKYQEIHTNDGGKVPVETALTNLVYNSLVKRNYKIIADGDYDEDGKEIELFDVVLWTNFSNDPFFMVVVEKDNGTLYLERCNEDCAIERKVC